MAKNFEVSKTAIADNQTDAVVAAAIETWLDALNIPTGNTVYSISIAHYQGFWHCICVYEP